MTMAAILQFLIRLRIRISIRISDWFFRLDTGLGGGSDPPDEAR